MPLKFPSIPALLASALERWSPVWLASRTGDGRRRSTRRAGRLMTRDRATVSRARHVNIRASGALGQAESQSTASADGQALNYQTLLAVLRIISTKLLRLLR